MNFRFFTLAILLLASNLQAASTEPVLTARPGLCIIKNKQAAACVMALELQWNASKASSLCLYHATSPKALRCWQSARTGQHHLELSSKEDVSYWLQKPDNQQHLAEISVRVVRLAQQRRPERRRRRHVWSVL